MILPGSINGGYMDIKNIVLSIFWAIIALIYLYLMIRHIRWSRDTYPSLQKRPTIAKISGVPLNIAETIQDINDFVDRLNEHSRKMNIAQFWGYLAAFIAALAALILTLQI